MIILGIDPGTTRIGFGIIEKKDPNLTSIHYGVITPSSKDRSAAIKEVISELKKIISIYKPDIASIEKLFFFKNHKTVMSVSEMRGVIMTVLVESGLPVYEFTPLQVKQAVSSYGRAGKSQVQDMVKLILGIKTKITPDDAADGLAIAICCANTIIGKL